MWLSNYTRVTLFFLLYADGRDDVERDSVCECVYIRRGMKSNILVNIAHVLYTLITFCRACTVFCFSSPHLDFALNIILAVTFSLQVFINLCQKKNKIIASMPLWKIRLWSGRLVAWSMRKWARGLKNLPCVLPQPSLTDKERGLFSSLRLDRWTSLSLDVNLTLCPLGWKNYPLSLMYILPIFDT